MMIKLQAIDLKCGYENKTVIESASLTAEPGEFITLLGPNGSGKSTLLKTMAGVLKRQGGSVILGEKDLKDYKPLQKARLISNLPQNPKAPADVTVEQLVSYGRTPYTGIFQKDIESAAIREWAMAETGVLQFKDRLLKTLSGGERQRVWISMCLCQKTRIILLDEPTTSLDIKHQEEVLKTLEKLKKEHGITVMCVLHDINHAIKYSDRVAMLKKGKILYSGHPEEVITEESIMDVFGVEGNLTEIPGKKRKYFIPD